MLCQTCSKNVALVRARIGNATVHICIPCAIDILNDDKDVELELERRLDVQAKPQTKTQQDQ